MKRPRFSIRGLSAAILVAGLGLYVLKIAVDHADELLIALTLAVVASFPLAMVSQRRVGVFLTGFAIVGATYLAVSNSPIGHYLPTEALTEGVAERWLPASDSSDDYQVFDEFVMPGSRRIARVCIVCRALTTLVFAVLGGTAVSLLVRPRKVEAKPADPPDGSLLGPGRWRTRLSALWDE
jgi:hypothetical protein